MNIQIYVPSYKRAGKTITDRWLKDCVLVVNESEKKEYKLKHKGHRIVAAPDSVKGNMAKVRNFILQQAFEKDKVDVCVMMDDDVSGVGYYEKRDPVRLKSKELYEHVATWATMAEEIGTVLFGVNLQSDPKFYREYSPFSLLSPVLGPFSCILPTDIKYDTRLSLNEDYDFFLQAVRRHRKVLRFNKYHYFAGHIDMEGGCAAHRRLDQEREQASVMIKKWGSKVVSYDFDRSINPRVRVPLRGI